MYRGSWIVPISSIVRKPEAPEGLRPEGQREEREARARAPSTPPRLRRSDPDGLGNEAREATISHC